MTATVGSYLTRLFWHRTRRVFLELTAQDAANRLNLHEGEAETMLDLMVQGGNVKRHAIKDAQSNSQIKTWRITDKGMASASLFIGDVP